MRKPTTTQYDVEFPTDAQVQAKVTRLLAKERVDQRSLVVTRVDGKTLVQFRAEKNDGLRERLERLGAAVREELVFQLEMPHNHWELHKLAKSLAEKDINILSLYTTIEGDNMRIVLAVDQPANAVALIEKLGFDPDYMIDE